jgi:hypothetical protein
MRKVAATLVWVLAAFVHGQTWAQAKPGLNILVEDLNANAIKCGINQSSIESIAALTLRNNGIRVTNNESGVPYLGLVATVLSLPTSGCAVSYSVNIFGFIPMPAGGIGGLKASHMPFTVRAQLCHRGAVLIMRSGDSSYFLEGVERLVKSCLDSLTY